jgi:hypothetical protein
MRHKKMCQVVASLQECSEIFFSELLTGSGSLRKKNFALRCHIKERIPFFPKLMSPCRALRHSDVIVMREFRDQVKCCSTQMTVADACSHLR